MLLVKSTQHHCWCPVGQILLDQFKKSHQGMAPILCGTSGQVSWQSNIDLRTPWLSGMDSIHDLGPWVPQKTRVLLDYCDFQKRDKDLLRNRHLRRTSHSGDQTCRVTLQASGLMMFDGNQIKTLGLFGLGLFIQWFITIFPMKWHSPGNSPLIKKNTPVCAAAALAANAQPLWTWKECPHLGCMFHVLDVRWILLWAQKLTDHCI